MPLLIASVAILGGMFGIYVSDAVADADKDILEVMAENASQDPILYDMQAYIKEAEGGDVSETMLFTGYNTGAYFEYAGFTHVYMDARPELLMEAVNGVTDILPEYGTIYSQYFQGYDYDCPIGEALQNSLDAYGFDYLVVQKGVENQLYAWLEGAGESSGYVIVMENDVAALYEKCN